MVIRTLGEGRLGLTPHYFFRVRSSTDPHREAVHLRTFLFFNPGEGERDTWLWEWGLRLGQSKWSPGARSQCRMGMEFKNLIQPKGKLPVQFVEGERPGREMESQLLSEGGRQPQNTSVWCWTLEFSPAVTSHRGARGRWGPGRVICIVVHRVLLTQLRNPTKLPGLDLTCLPVRTLASSS